MTRKTNKTPKEIALEAMARAERANLRAAQAEANENPLLAQVQNAIENENKTINTLSRKLNGPNSFVNRIASTVARLDWIKAEASLVGMQDQLARERKNALQHGMADLALRMQKGEAVGPNDVQVILDNLPQSDMLASLIALEAEKKAAWKYLTVRETDSAPQQDATA